MQPKKLSTFFPHNQYMFAARASLRLTTAKTPSLMMSSSRLAAASAAPGAVRIEHDTMGQMEVPADRYWGCQTQRSLMNFDIGGPSERMPEPLMRAFGVLKGAAATVNMRAGTLSEEVGGAIIKAAAEGASLRFRGGI